MNALIAVSACIVGAAAAYRVLHPGARLRLAIVAAQCSCLLWVGLRFFSAAYFQLAV